MEKYTTKADVEITKEEAEKAMKFYDKPEGRFVPEYGNKYWVVEHTEGTYTSVWANDRIDNFRLLQGNVFRTEEEAKEHLAYLKAVVVIKEDAEWFVPDWSDDDQMKFFGEYCHYLKKIECDYDYLIQTPNTIYFESVALLLKSQELHDKEWMIYLGIK